MLMNKERFRPNSYDDETIEQFVFLTNRQFEGDRPTWMEAKVFVDTVEDETGYIQDGTEVERNFLHAELGVNQPSSWRSYPNHYKLIGVEFMVSSDINNIARETLDIFTFLGDIGGLLDLLILIFGYFLMPFAEKRMEALLTNRLFHLTGDKTELSKKVLSATKGKASSILKTRPSGDVEVDVPFWLDMQMLWSKVCCVTRCWRNKEYEIYNDILDLGMDKVTQQLDVIR